LIVAHSFGNLQTVHNLWNMSQQERDLYVARYIALAPPYLGSTQLVSSEIGYADNYMFNLYITQLGIVPSMFKDGMASAKGVFNLMP
jgi:predicted alpha/beta hydrolase family esterase